MYERLVKSLEGWLMGRVRGQIELSLQGSSSSASPTSPFGSSTPCCSYLVDIRDSGGQQGVIDFGPPTSPPSSSIGCLVDAGTGDRSRRAPLRRSNG